MLTFFYIFFFIFGAIIGSFLNVVVLRYNTGLSITRGSSKCFSCGHKLSWYELIPIISFLVLRGRCINCKSKISWQYPIVEIITGLSFLIVFYKIGFDYINLLISLIIVSLLVAIAVYDFKHKIIPDGMVFTFAGFSLFSVFYNIGFNNIFHMPYLMELLSGPILFLFFFILWIVSAGRWIGFGDAKLALGMGWFLGFSSGISALIISFWSGAIVGLLLIYLQKLNLGRGKITIKSEIPFAPFIIFAIFLEFLFSFDIWHIGALI